MVEQLSIVKLELGVMQVAALKHGTLLETIVLDARGAGLGKSGMKDYLAILSGQGFLPVEGTGRTACMPCKNRERMCMISQTARQYNSR